MPAKQKVPIRNALLSTKKCLSSNYFQNKKLMIDFYYYFGKYENFISGVTVLQSRNAAAPSPLDVLDASKRIAYSISTC